MTLPSFTLKENVFPAMTGECTGVEKTSYKVPTLVLNKKITDSTKTEAEKKV